MHAFWRPSIKYGLLWDRHEMAPFGVSLLVAASRKTHVFCIQKMKNGFFVKQVGTLLWQHCFPSQDGGMRPIWAYYQKLFNGCGHIIASLAWKAWIFVRGRSFLRTLFQENAGIASLVFLLVGRPHLMMWHGGLPFFWFFLNFLWCFQKPADFVAAAVRG